MGRFLRSRAAVIPGELVDALLVDDPRQVLDVGCGTGRRRTSAGGRIGLFWNFGDLPADVRERLAPIYARLAPDLENYSILLGHHHDRVETTRAEITVGRDPSADGRPGDVARHSGGGGHAAVDPS